MQPFKGKFWGTTYDHSRPPPRQFNNASNCEQFVDFINSEISFRLKSGAVSYLGKVAEVEPPYIVSPLTIEPNKPRMCINLMYLNCFMKDTPLTLDTLADVPNIVKPSSYMTKCLSFQWGGHYFCCNTLPFGWKKFGFRVSLRKQIDR